MKYLTSILVVLVAVSMVCSPALAGSTLKVNCISIDWIASPGARLIATNPSEIVVKNNADLFRDVVVEVPVDYYPVNAQVVLTDYDATVFEPAPATSPDGAGYSLIPGEAVLLGTIAPKGRTDVYCVFSGEFVIDDPTDPRRDDLCVDEDMQLFLKMVEIILKDT